MKPVVAIALALTAACATATPVPDRTDTAPAAPPPATTATTAAKASTGSKAKKGASDPEISAEAYRAVLEAELKLQAGDVPGGIELLREAVLHDPQSPYLHVRLAQAYLEAGDAEQARASAQDALAIDRKTIAAWRVLGEAWNAAGDKSAAKKAYREALTTSPGDRDVSMELAELLVEDGDLDLAEKTIEALMEKEPGAVDGYVAIARVFAQRGEVERAFRHVERALERDPADVDALALKLTLLWGLGRFGEALPVANQIAAAAGDGDAVRRDLLSATVLAGKLDDADALAKAWLDDDGSEHMRLLVADAFDRAGERLRAITALVPLLNAASSSPRAAAEVGRLRLNGHEAAAAAAGACPAVESAAGVDAKLHAAVVAVCLRADVQAKRAKDAGALVQKKLGAIGDEPAFLEAATVVVKQGAFDAKELMARADVALGEKPNDVDVVSEVARVHEELGDVIRARQILDDALRTKPKDPDLLFALARHLDRQKQPLPAIDIMERLLDRGHRGIDELNFVAFMLAENNMRPDEAKKDAWRALVQEPLNGYVVDTLGWAQLVAGDDDAAIETLKRADKLAPDEAEILFHLGAALEKKGDKKTALDFADRARTLIDDDDPVKPRIDALVDKLKKAS